MGANMAFHRDALLELGGFDTNLGRKGSTLLSGEEAAIVHRLRQRGLPVYYCGRAVVWHAVPPARRRRRWLWKRMFWDGASQPLLDSGPGRPARPLLAPGICGSPPHGAFRPGWLSRPSCRRSGQTIGSRAGVRSAPVAFERTCCSPLGGILRTSGQTGPRPVRDGLSSLLTGQVYPHLSKRLVSKHLRFVNARSGSAASPCCFRACGKPTEMWVNLTPYGRGSAHPNIASLQIAHD